MIILMVKWRARQAGSQAGKEAVGWVLQAVSRKHTQHGWDDWGLCFVALFGGIESLVIWALEMLVPCTLFTCGTGVTYQV